jgi:hypothetical protein
MALKPAYRMGKAMEAGGKTATGKGQAVKTPGKVMVASTTGKGQALKSAARRTAMGKEGKLAKETVPKQATGMTGKQQKTRRQKKAGSDSAIPSPAEAICHSHRWRALATKVHRPVDGGDGSREPSALV